MTTAFRFRRLDARDSDALRTITEETFLDTFAAQNEPENIATYVAAAFNTGQVASELANEHSEFFFIEAESDVAGYLKLNTGAAQTEQALPNALEIERIYVRRSHQGTGAGKALMHHAIARAIAAKVDWLWLGVWDQNQKAIDFYRASGFTAFGQHDFYMGRDLQHDIMMKRPIQHVADRAPHDKVVP